MSTVSVACKHPAGMILKVFKMVEQSEPVMGGGTKMVPRAEQVGPSVRVHGTASPFGKVPKALIIGGYAITPNVDAEFWAAWLFQNADHDAVLNKVIFAHEKHDLAEKRARDNESVRSGLEAIDPARLPRGIETATEKAA